MRPGRPFIGRHSPLARGADRQTPDRAPAPPEGPVPCLLFRRRHPTPPEDPRSEAQTLTAWYADRHAELGRRKPTKAQIGIVAQTIGEKLEGGAKPEHVREAIRKLVEKGNAPSHLASFVSEVEAKRTRSGPTYVPFVPPSGPDPKEEEVPMPSGLRARMGTIGKPIL